MGHSGGHASCAAFDWMSLPPPAVSAQSWDLILCADLVYSFASVEPFVNALASVLSSVATRSADEAVSGYAGASSTGLVKAVYAHNPRSPELDAQMHAALQARGLLTRVLPASPVAAVG